MSLNELFDRPNRHHLTIRFDPDQLEQILMTISSAAQAILDELAAIKAAVVNEETGEGTQAGADLAAIKAQVDDLKAAVSPPPAALSVTPASLPTPAAGTAYSEALTVSGGVAPYAATITGADSTATVSVSGNQVTVSDPTPVSGTYTGEVKITDAASPENSVSVPFSWTF